MKMEFIGRKNMRRRVEIDNSEATNGRIYTGAEIEAMTEPEMFEKCDALVSQGFHTRAAELLRGWNFEHRYSRYKLEEQR